jgi:hypothetical protein
VRLPVAHALTTPRSAGVRGQYCAICGVCIAFNL